MDESQLQSVRRFNRLVTQRVGALEVDYLHRGRPLAEARLIFEISADGADVRALRSRLGLDSGYLSRLLQSLKTQGLIAVTKGDVDGRRRNVSLTRKGNAERAAYDRLSDNLAESMLDPLDTSEQNRSRSQPKRRTAPTRAFVWTRTFASLQRVSRAALTPARMTPPPPKT